MRLVLRPWLLSSDINEVVKTVLNIIFLHKDFTRTKKHKKV